MKYTLTLLLAVVVLHLGAQLNTELVGNLDYEVDVNDVWGYVAPDGTEYALLGLYDGVAVISLADPASPVEVARVRGQDSNWRDMKTYGEFGYVVADEGDAGLTVIDLRSLPDSISYSTQQYTVPDFERAFVRAHNLYVDNERGLIFTAGGDRNLNDGGILIFDAAADPLAPPLVAVGPETYAHDVYVQDGVMYASEIYRGELALYDVTELTNITKLGVTPTPFAFTHNAWATADGRTVFTTDERANASVAAFDLSDYGDIRLLDEYRPLSSLDTRTIPHNVHVIDDFLSISYYTDGLRVVDASDPANLIEVANYDTWPGADGGFNGDWGAYPFLPSGLTLVSDRATGLYVIDVDYKRAARLAGTISNAVTGAPINGAEVVILDAYLNRGTTNAAGRYATGVVVSETDTYRVRVSAPGYFADTVSVRLTSGQEAVQSVALEPQIVATTTLSLRDRITDEPIGEGQVLLVRDSLQYRAVGDTLAQVTLTDVPSQGYRLTATAWGYRELRIPEVEVTALADTVLYLERGYADSFISDLGWSVTGDTTAGAWQRGPAGDVQDLAYLTGRVDSLTGDTIGVVSGRTVLVSPYIDLRAYRDSAILSYAYYVVNEILDPGDSLRVELAGPAGAVLLAAYGSTGGEWLKDSIDLIGMAGLSDSLQLRISVGKQGADGRIEAGFDDFFIRDGDLTAPVGQVASDRVALRVYPNPSATYFTLELPAGLTTGPKLEVYDVRGVLVEQVAVPLGGRRINFGAALPRGGYVVRSGGMVVRVVKW
ncbi:choice-of-anchor B family protein [Neolewinella sp.]|uniref:choice-of-anchor B family protein n=1 Tax=Neolewinella sp. TaxID=2993543 RepID=UPI003B51D85C